MANKSTIFYFLLQYKNFHQFPLALSVSIKINVEFLAKMRNTISVFHMYIPYVIASGSFHKEFDNPILH